LKDLKTLEPMVGKLLNAE
jgi:hypothetical protein